MTLSALHTELAKHGLAMINLGSISDQTLGGVVTTATHGTGMHFKVISTHVLALTLLLADGSIVRCSRSERAELFNASLCGLGATGLMLDITLEVGPAFRLKERQESISFDEVVQNVDAIANSAEHVRLWWFPQAGTVRVSSASRTEEVRVRLSVHGVGLTRRSRGIPWAVSCGTRSSDSIWCSSCSLSASTSRG